MAYPPTRRQLLRLLSVGGAVAVAGCGGSGDGESSPGGSPDTDADVQVTTTAGSGAGESTPTETVAAGSESEADLLVTDLRTESDGVTQGARVTLTVELESTVSEGDPHVVTVVEGDRELRRTRVASGATATRSFWIRCDRSGTRTFAVGDAQASVDVEPHPASFVGTDDTSFVLDGDPFPVFGTNNATLHHKTRKTVDEVFRDAAAMGFNVVRLLVNGAGTDVGYCREFACGAPFPGLQPAPREYDESAFRRLDYAVAAAKRHGIRLVVSLLTLQPGGVAAYLDWVDDAATMDDFYTNAACKAIYRDYVEYVLTRENTITGLEYREDPTVLTWELINEPELSGRPFGPALQDWIGEMARHAKSVDGNHLVSAGLIGWNDAGNEADYLDCFVADAVDVASTHLYYDADGADDWIPRHARGVHEELDKPLYVGEFGWDATRTDPDYETQLTNRDEGFQRWIDQCLDTDVAGALCWHLIGHLDDGARYPDHDGFGIYYPEDETTVAVLESAVEEFGVRRPEVVE